MLETIIVILIGFMVTRIGCSTGGNWKFNPHSFAYRTGSFCHVRLLTGRKVV